jgi:DNA (cytosine-5)-methyltransferase 1
VNEGFRYIDLFCGMGGFRSALDPLGGRCVYSSEINPDCRETYRRNFGDDPDGDITKVDENTVPDHDLLCGGFPCQSFSIAGLKMGFKDPRGTLFFDMLRITKAKRPKALLLENVKHFSKHDKGSTIETVRRSLEGEGYHFSWKILNAKDFGVPQNRERTIMVASLEREFDFSKVKTTRTTPRVADVLEDEPLRALDPEDYTILPKEQWRKQSSGLLFVGYRNREGRKAGVRENTRHLSRAHKQPNRIYHAEGTHPTIPSQESAGRFWVYDGSGVRRMSARECLRIQGFPNSHLIPDRESKAYRQIGNSVPPPMVGAVAEEMTRQGLV